MTQGKATKEDKEKAAKLAQIKELMGEEEFAKYMAFDTANTRRELEKTAKENANKACTEDGTNGPKGRFYDEYAPLDKKLSAIYARALEEEREKLGLPKEEPKK